MASRSQMQQLLRKLSEHNYIEWHRCYDNTDIVKDLFWAHPIRRGKMNKRIEFESNYKRIRSKL